MRIAYVTQSYPPMVSGASIVAKNLAENMATRGHKVLVIAASDRGKSYKSISGNVTVLRLRSVHNPFRVGQKFMIAPRRVFNLALQDFQPDVIHTHDALQLGVLSLAYRRKQNVPVLLTIHALPHFAAKYIPDALSSFRPTLETLLWMYARVILRQFNAVTTPTPTTSRTVYAMTKIRPMSISNGVDLDEFKNTRLAPDREVALRNKLNLPLNIPLILYVGRLDNDKRVDQVIRASVQTMQKTNAHLVIVGDGHQKKTLQKLSRSLGIERRCHFLGYISVKEGLPEIYRIADLFVTASEIETQGIVLLEAAASGLPIAAVRATCIPETVYNGVNGYLTEPNDPIALGKAITNLIMNPAKAEQMGKAGRRLTAGHNLLTTFDSFEHLYADLLKNQTVERYPATVKVKIHSWQERAREWLNL